MSEQTEKKNKYISATITTVVVILLLLLFWYVTIDYDIPQLPKETLVEIEIIEPESGGSGSPGAMTPEETSIPKMSLPAPSTEQTRDQTAAPVKQTSTTTVKNPDPNSEEFNPSNIYNKKQNQNNNTSNSNQPDFNNGPGGKGNGNDGGNGNKPGAGDGNGFSHSFGKRPIRAANITHDCGIKGKIILEVSVSPDGRITILDTDPGSTQNDCLERYAKKFVNGSKFDKVDANNNATGTITIYFDLN